MEKLYGKVIKNPFLGKDITVYADLPSASFFHNQHLLPILDGIRSETKKNITNEDNEVEIYLRMTSPTSFRATYRLHQNDAVKALIIQFDEKDRFLMYTDPLL